MAVCFDFCSTNVVQLSNRNLYFYRFWCHHPLITQLSFSNNFSSLQLKSIKDIELFYFLLTNCVLLRQIEIPYFLTVYLSIPVNKLPWFDGIMSVALLTQMSTHHWIKWLFKNPVLFEIYLIITKKEGICRLVGIFAQNFTTYLAWKSPTPSLKLAPNKFAWIPN